MENEKIKCVCPKHGELREEYVLKVHIPEFGYDKMTYCMVCATDYLALIAQEVKLVPVEEVETQENNDDIS